MRELGGVGIECHQLRVCERIQWPAGEIAIYAKVSVQDSEEFDGKRRYRRLGAWKLTTSALGSPSTMKLTQYLDMRSDICL